MKKNKVDDIKLINFKVKYRLIFLNTKFLSYTKNHFDKKHGFAAFLLAFIANQIGDKKLLQHIKINLEEWLNIFMDLYDNKQIIKSYERIMLNPVINSESLAEIFDCFDNEINKIVQYLNDEQLNLNINEFQLKQIIKNAFSFIMYNTLDCKIYYDFAEILFDQEYDQKLAMILNNTKLFANAKRSILNNCGSKVSDLITLLLGISNPMNHEKKLINFKKLTNSNNN